LFKKIKIALGILTRTVLTGPLEAAVDISNSCGLGCITCWFYSPLRKDKPPADWARRQMSFDLFRRIADELKALEVRKIMLGGDGDPFTHPRIIDMLEYSRQAGLEVDTATCGIFFDDASLRRLFEAGIDRLSISILAATPRDYAAMHPGRGEDLFEKIKRSLALLAKWKREENKQKPYITLVDVISRLNCSGADRMIDFAAETGANEVAFKRMSAMPFTRDLLLDDAQARELGLKLQAAAAKAKAAGVAENIESFLEGTLPGLASGDYTSDVYAKIPCYIGWIYTRILCDGSVVPCCGCYDYRLGNAAERPLREIWHSKEYAEFRAKSINIRNDRSIAGRCACHSCVHAGMNMGIYRSLHFMKRNPDG